MVHAGAVAESPEELNTWIARTDDLRERLTKSGYGSEFDAHDLFPLFQAYVAKATTPGPPPPRADRARWLWIGAIVVAAITVVIVFATMAS
ncbi:MAG TPA: hypothetical protein VF701_18405, partial [Thermoanaerobaculia bacterium]